MNDWIDVSNALPEIPYCNPNKYDYKTRRWGDGTKLVSKWVEVKDIDNNIYEAYYHVLHGWMIKGEPIELFIYGYIPINRIITHWRIKK